MKKVSWIVVITGAAVGLAAIVLTLLGNPANMGFCIACFLRDIAGACGLHSAAKVQYVRPEIIGLVLGAFIMSVATREFRAKAGSSPATRFVLGAVVMIGALAFLGCPLRMIIRLGGGDLNALVALVGFACGILCGVFFLNRGFSLKRAHPVGKAEGGVLPAIMAGLLILFLAVPALFKASTEGPGSMHAPVVAALLIALVVGALAQRARLCMAGGLQMCIRDRNLFITHDGAYVLAGSTLELGYAATDNALRTVETPGVTASASRGSVSGNVYTAPASAGTDTIRLSSGSAYGSGTLHVITKADSLSVTDAESGTALTSAVLEQGETLSLKVAAKYLLRDVYMNAEDVTYSVSGSIGTITKDGLFTATGAPGAEGKITVAAAGVTAEISVKLEIEFADMRGHWAESYVKALYKDGIVTGITDTQFGPDQSMKRCDFVLMLYRAAGSPAVSERSGFTDVPDSAYYATAVAWAYANGITEGKGEGTFAPADTLTRQEGFTFLYRALKTLGVSYTDADASQLSRFPDASSVASWAQTPTATLIALGVVEGSDSGLIPTSSLTRAQMAKMLQTARELA